MANTYGYIRVSSRDQNEDRQMIALKEVGVAECAEYLMAQQRPAGKFPAGPLHLPTNSQRFNCMYLVQSSSQSSRIIFERRQIHWLLIPLIS